MVQLSINLILVDSDVAKCIRMGQRFGLDVTLSSRLVNSSCLRVLAHLSWKLIWALSFCRTLWFTVWLYMCDWYMHTFLIFIFFFIRTNQLISTKPGQSSFPPNETWRYRGKKPIKILVKHRSQLLNACTLLHILCFLDVYTYYILSFIIKQFRSFNFSA